MLPPEYKEFENILHKVFSVGSKYIKDPVLDAHRLELRGNGYEGIFYFDTQKNALVKKPEYYGSCQIELKSKDKDGNKIWRVNIVNRDSDTIYEFTENTIGKIGDGIEVFRENLSNLDWNL